VKLTAEQNNERMELYREGWTDKKIGDSLGISYSTVFGWRTKYGLPANSKIGTYKRTVSSGVPMNEALPPDGCRLVKAFLQDLVAIAGKAEKGNMDISRFIRRWREIGGVDVQNDTK
jgi:hypothetical protein